MMSPDDKSEANDEHWLAERRKVFREVIDINKDGIVNEAELKVIINLDSEWGITAVMFWFSAKFSDFFSFNW